MKLLTFSLLSGLAASTIPTQWPLTTDGNFVGSSMAIPGTNASYDYVIIGGGTAGLALATRLAQNQTASVAVIEAGGFYETDNGNLSIVPSSAVYYCGADPSDYQPLIDWGISTTPQAGLGNRRIHYARGKTLGGSSARNFLIYQRGTNESYQRWADEVGDESYTFENLLPYFYRSSNFTPADNAVRAANASITAYNPRAFGNSSQEQGPLKVTYPRYANSFTSWARKGLAQLGLHGITDFVSGGLIGFAYNMQSIDPGTMTRSSSETSYLTLGLNTACPLAIYKNTLAKRILFSPNKTANGVLVQTGGMIYQINATREVILSAGTFQSPQLLMVSGVGPAETLKQYSIPVVKALAGVGQNMWDHILFGPTYVLSVVTHSIVGNTAFRLAATAQYLKNATGIIGNSGGDFLAWEKLPEPYRSKLSPSSRSALAQFPPDWPEVEWLFFDAYVGKQTNYIYDSPTDGKMYAGPVGALVAPLSRGNVTIRSADTDILPVVNPAWLTHPADQQMAVQIYRRLRDLMTTEEMKKIVVGEEVYPGKNVTTDAEILQVIRESALTVWHAASTCKMGRENDTMAVIDTHARVYGVNNLRVVDASSFPFLPPGHPQATVYALAEKIAQDILDGR